MDWNLFWSAFVAIGTTLGSLTTAIAVVVAVVQYKQPLTKRINIETNTSVLVSGGNVSENYLYVSLANTGVRTIYISNICFKAGKKNLFATDEQLMLDFTRSDLKVIFPHELKPEMCMQVFIPYKKLSKEIFNLIKQKKISPKQKLKILALDTTSGKYFSKTIFTAKQIANYCVDNKEEYPND